MPSRKKSTHLVLITGMSGSGKSVALHALEDAGYYCVDNLPPELLLPFVRLERKHAAYHLAIAMDVRSASSLPLVPPQLEALRAQGMEVKIIFLDSSTDTLVRRFSETRRKHPLSQSDAGQLEHDTRNALVDAIELERAMLAGLREQAHVIDSSIIRPSQLQANIKSFITTPSGQITLVFQSFAFKRGTPNDADFIFDVRMLPNPHYEPELRALTGRDQPVADFLNQQQEAQRMLQHIAGFLDQWMDAMVRDHRSYVTVAIGCTGGQHRSVYLVEKLAQQFSKHWTTLKRHREIDVPAASLRVH